MWLFVLVFSYLTLYVECLLVFNIDAVTLNGNDLSLNLPSLNKNSYSASRIYEFYEGENVLINCRQPKNLTGPYLTGILSESIEYIGNKILLQFYDNKSTSFLYMKLSKDCDKRHVDCQLQSFNRKLSITIRIIFKMVSGKPQAPSQDDLTKRLKKYITDKLVIGNNETKYCDLPGEVPCIKGLMWSKILAIYYQNKNKMIIAYPYYDIGEKIDIQCVADKHDWIYNEYAVSRREIHSYISTFQINSPDRADIICKSTNHSTQIIFVRVERTTSKPTEEPTTTFQTHRVRTEEGGHPITENGDHNTGPDIKHKPTGWKSLVLIIISVTVSLILLIVVIVCFIKCMKKKPKQPNANVNIDYETLPEHNKGTMPVPSQWREEEYANPSDGITNNDYAVPFKPSLEEMYSKPLPKSQRNTNEDNSGYTSIENLVPTANTSKFTNINKTKVLPTSTGSISYAKLAKANVAAKPYAVRTENPYTEIKYDGSETASENPYAEVNYNEINYADPNKPGHSYENVFDNKRYANTNNRNDYDELTYCEPYKNFS